MRRSRRATSGARCVKTTPSVCPVHLLILGCPSQQVKTRHVSDPRYDAVNSSSLRESLFTQHVASLSSSSSAPAAKLDKATRAAASLKEREEQVRGEKERMGRSAAAARGAAGREEGEREFQSLLIDTVRDHEVRPSFPNLFVSNHPSQQARWDAVLPFLSADTRFSTSPLSPHDQRRLLDAHLTTLYSKRLAVIESLFLENSPSLASPFTPILDAIASLPAVTRLVGSDERRLKGLWETWKAKREFIARREFDELLRESPVIEHWGRLQKKAKEEGATEVKAEEEEEEDDGVLDIGDMAKQVDIKAVHAVLKVSGRFLFSCGLGALTNYFAWGSARQTVSRLQSHPGEEKRMDRGVPVAPVCSQVDGAPAGLGLGGWRREERAGWRRSLPESLPTYRPEAPVLLENDLRDSRKPRGLHVRKCGEKTEKAGRDLGRIRQGDHFFVLSNIPDGFLSSHRRPKALFSLPPSPTDLSTTLPLLVSSRAAMSQRQPPHREPSKTGERRRLAQDGSHNHASSDEQDAPRPHRSRNPDRRSRGDIGERDSRYGDPFPSLDNPYILPPPETDQFPSSSHPPYSSRGRPARKDSAVQTSRHGTPTPGMIALTNRTLWQHLRSRKLLLVFILVLVTLCLFLGTDPRGADSMKAQRCAYLPWLAQCKSVDHFASLQYDTSAGYLVYPARSLVDVATKLPPQPHPIHLLITKGEAAWAAKKAAQTTTLHGAVAEYRRRYNMAPPKGFGEWWAYANSSGVQLMDEYDSIYNKFLPFASLPRDVLQDRSDRLQNDEDLWLRGMAFTVQVRDQGRDIVAVGPMAGTGPRAGQVVDMFKGFGHYLPDLNITITSASNS